MVMELLDGRYYAIHFDDVSAAVNYCGAMVPHLVTRLRTGEPDGMESPAIWFHLAPHSNGLSGGCDLIMTRGAILAAMAGALQTPSMNPASRTVLPPGAVLVLGEDSRQAPIAARTRRRMPALHAPNRLNKRSA
jgi:hypothetical protein